MKKNKVIAIYEKIANWFDMHRNRELIEKAWLDKAIALLPQQAHILDLGCGTGEPIGQYFTQRGFNVTGVDASTKMLEMARMRCPNTKFILADMRRLNLSEKFDCIVAWHSYFHLSQVEQHDMFKIFTNHLNPGGLLLFTSGQEAGEVWGENGGENLYHASLSPEEYRALFKQHGFIELDHIVEDPECGEATIWLIQLGKN